jgi:hypothetical protein
MVATLFCSFLKLAFFPVFFLAFVSAFALPGLVRLRFFFRWSYSLGSTPQGSVNFDAPPFWRRELSCVSCGWVIVDPRKRKKK